MAQRVLLVDDHVAVSEGLRTLLAKEMPELEVGIAADWEAAEQACRSQMWNLAVVDVDLPGRSGLDLIPELTKIQPRLEILVYSFHKETQFGMRAIRAGARGYLNKAAPASQVFEAVRTVLRGHVYANSDLEELLVNAVTSSSGGPPHTKLSNRELEVMRKLVTGNPIKQIAGDLNLSQKTISTYRARILEKLSLSSTADLVRYSIEHGLDATNP